MKNKLLPLLAIVFLTASANATITFSGSSLNNAPTLASGQVGVYLVSTDGTSFTDGSLSSLGQGLSITDSATYGSSFAVIGSNSVVTFGNTFLSSGNVFSHGSGVDLNDAFGVVVFDSSTTSTIESDTFQIWTDSSWLVPADAGGTFTFNSEFNQLSSASQALGTVVPEPSAYATIAGLLALGWVATRRRS